MGEESQPQGIKIEGSLLNKEFETPVNDAPPANNDTPPVVNDTPPANNTASNTDTPPAIIPFEQKWGEEFGDVALPVVKEKFSKYDAIYSEYEQLKQKPTYRTDAGKQIDEWLDKGVKLETIAKFGSVKAGELSDDQAIKLRAEIENPNWQAKHIEADFNSKYSYTPNELVSEDENSTQQTLKEAAKMKDASAAKAFLAEYLDKQLNPSGELEAAKQKQAESRGQLAQSWSTNISALSNSVKEVKDELTFKVPSDKGEEEVKLPYSYVVPENDLKTLVDFAVQNAVNEGIQPTAEGVKQVSAYVNRVIWGSYGPKIVQAALTDALSKQQSAFAKMINNPTLADGTSSVTQGAPSFDTALLNAELKRSGR